MGLARRIQQRGLALRQYRRDEQVLCRSHAGLVEEQHRAVERRGHAELELLLVYLDAEPPEAVEMRVEPPPPDRVPSRRVQLDASDAGEERGDQQE